MQRRPSNRFLMVLALCLCCPAPGVVAADPPQGEVRFNSVLEEPAWVGQEVQLNLELWSNGFSFGDQLFMLPEVRGGFLLQGDASTVKLSENRGGEAWQGLRYTLLLYPQTAGRLEVPAFDVSFTARAGFGSAPKAFQFRTEPLRVEVRLPPGAQSGDLLVTTGAFDFAAKWDRSLPPEGPLRLQTGDALTLEVRRSAADVPGMVFAPVPVPEIEGLGVYPAKPSVRDQVNRGELSGTRTDRLTVVCESPGLYVLPEMRFQWWDPGAQRLSEHVVPALHLEVEANPAYGQTAASGQGDARGERYGRAFLVLLVVLILGAAVRRFGGLLWLRLRSLRPRGAAASSAPKGRTGRLLPLNPR